MPTNTNCMLTKVRNMSGKTATFGFLPPHGKRLTSGEEYTFFGSPETLLGAITKKRQREAFLQALKDEVLVIVSTPAVHVYDETKDVTKVLGVNNGTVTAGDPCWGTYSSSIAG
jgi:hypothetical protein